MPDPQLPAQIVIGAHTLAPTPLVLSLVRANPELVAFLVAT